MQSVLHEGERSTWEKVEMVRIERRSAASWNTIVHGRGWEKVTGLRCGKAFFNSLAAPHHDSPI